MKNNLSRLLEAVKRGETILVLDRDTPVARIEPVGERAASLPGRLSDLVKRGVVSPPYVKLDIEKFLARDMARIRKGASGVQALLDERKERP